MAKVTASCRMMQNAFPAAQLSLDCQFYVVEDTEGEHMIFSIDQRGKLCLIVKGNDGHNELVNLSESFHLHESSNITALAVTQSRQHTIYLAFAITKSDGSKYSDLHVLKPMPADRQTWLDSERIRASLYSGEQSSVSISSIIMGNSNDRPDAQYPQIYTTLGLADSTTQDIWSITVDNSTASWKREKGFEMPCNPDKIVSMCIGNIGNKKFDAFYRGLFVLFKEATTEAALQLRFVGLDFSLASPTLQSFKQPVPSNARLLASFDNLDGFTDLMVATNEQLFWRSGADFLTEAQTPYRAPLPYEAPIGASPRPNPVAGCKQMLIAQAGDKLSIWTLDADSLLSYQEYEIFKKVLKTPQSPPKELSPRIPLLERSANSARFASIQHPTLGQKLFIISETNTMSMLQQNLETRMWQSPIDVMIPDSDEIREFLSHTISIQVDDETYQPICGQELVLCSSIAAEMIINGVSLRGSPEGLLVKTDEAGSLTVIIPTDGIAAPVLCFKDAPGSAFLRGQVVNIDPMQKLWDEMAQVKTVEDLKTLELPDGTPFVRSNLSKQDLQKALEAIQNLCQARHEIGVQKLGVESSIQLASDRRWGAWLWVPIDHEEAFNWAVKKIGSAWSFVVTIAGQVWEFIVENFPQVAAALQKILEFLCEGSEWLIQKFGEVLPWDDILLVKNALVNITTAGVLIGSDMFAGLEQKADGCFADMRNKVRALKNQRLPSQLAGINLSKNPPEPEGESGKELNDLMKTPSVQYGAYHLRHSAGNEPAKINSGGSILPDTPLSRLQKRLSGIWDSIVDLAKRFGANIVDLFTNKEFNLQLLLEKVGLELAEDALAVMQKAVTALLGSLSDLLLELADAMNMEMKMPVIGPLYSRLTNGSRLTTIDVVCFLLAIPATIVYRVFIGDLPKADIGWQKLVKADAMKDALDLRLEHIKNGAFLNSRTPHAITPICIDWWAEVGKVGSNVVTVLLPVASGLYTICYKLPKAMAEPVSATVLRKLKPAATWKLVMKLVFYIGKGMIIVRPKLKNFTTDVETMAKKAFEDVVFGYKFITWAVPGFFPIVGHMVTEYVGNCAEVVSAILQTIYLFEMHIDFAISKVSYPWNRCLEEYMNSLGNVAVAVAMMLGGKEPESLGWAFGATGGGKTLSFFRVKVESDMARITGSDEDITGAADDTV